MAPRRRRDGANPCAVVPILPAERAFAELVCLSKSSLAEEYYAKRSGNKWISD